MPSLDPHHAVLRRQWAQESQALERRRLCLQAAARTVALVLKERWPQLEDVWLFGSAATPQGPGGVAIDLVRLEDLEPHWQRRIRERAYRLT